MSQQRASQAAYRAALRRAVRRNQAEPEINFLNITAMLDIMTIILVFLLKSLGESSAAVPQSDDLQIPTSVLRSEPSQEGVVLTLSKTQILLEGTPVLQLPSREAMVQSGVGAEHKRNGPTDLYITPLGVALARARQADRLVRQTKAQDSSYSEAIIIADHSTPFRLLLEVLSTLGQNEFARYHLMVMQAKSAG